MNPYAESDFGGLGQPSTVADLLAEYSRNKASITPPSLEGGAGLVAGRIETNVGVAPYRPDTATQGNTEQDLARRLGSSWADLQAPAINQRLRADLEGQGFTYSDEGYVPPAGYNLSEADFQAGIQRAYERSSGSQLSEYDNAANAYQEFLNRINQAQGPLLDPAYRVQQVDPGVMATQRYENQQLGESLAAEAIQAINPGPSLRETALYPESYGRPYDLERPSIGFNDVFNPYIPYVTPALQRVQQAAGDVGATAGPLFDPLGITRRLTGVGAEDVGRFAGEAAVPTRGGEIALSLLPAAYAASRARAAGQSLPRAILGGLAEANVPFAPNAGDAGRLGAGR